MNFELTQQQAAIQETARKFAQEELLPGVLERDANSEFPVEQFHKMGELGLVGLPYPKEVGGQGADYLSYVLAVEEISKVDASMGIGYSVVTSLYGGSIMNSAAPVEKKREFLEEVLSGKCFGSFGLTEPNAGSDAGGCVTVAEKDGDDYILNGRKTFITGAPVSDYVIVFAKTNPELGVKGISTFVVDSKLEGVSFGKAENKMGMIGCPTSDVVLENVRVSKDCMLGREGKGFINAMKTLSVGRLGIACQALGLAEGAMEEAIKYAKSRHQFGKSIAKFQNTQFILAEMETKLAAMRHLVYDLSLIHI